uniref:RL2_5 n=1 Tax=Human herpesvirus 2 TaxID=10310 RepID=A0A481TUS7_HHV2|nr:RL2_6 [Human alphaherpesvirus 2]QBH83985.1 RL2_5 [Human alphaherpesvirus 2]
MLMGFLESTRLVPGDGAAPRGGDSLPPPPPGRAAIGGIVNAAPLGEWIGAGYKAAPCDGRAAFAPRHCERRSGGPAGGGDPERQRLKPGKRETAGRRLESTLPRLMEPRPGTSSRADPGPERPPRQTPGTVRGRPPGLRPPLFPGPPGCGLGVVAGGGLGGGDA